MRLNFVLGRLARGNATALLHSRSFRFGMSLFFSLLSLFHNSVFVRLLYPLPRSLWCAVCVSVPICMRKFSDLCAYLLRSSFFTCSKRLISFANNAEELSSDPQIGLQLAFQRVHRQFDHDPHFESRKAQLSVPTVSACVPWLLRSFKSTNLKGKPTAFLPSVGSDSAACRSFGLFGNRKPVRRRPIGSPLERLSIVADHRERLADASRWTDDVCKGSPAAA